ncbi:unnamed protein product [Rotaria sordida]|uniref:Transposase n=1 Tax=Rotaria sordida TaxID=392033 RepID=A0A814WNN1_9BILA|nr:unnamed protein product [Rotaria sordida]
MGGKCGLCGDPIDGPRNNEAPNGKYFTGTIVGTYRSGAVIDVRIEMMATHLESMNNIDFQYDDEVDVDENDSKEHSSEEDSEWYQRSNTTEPRLSLMISTDGKPIIKSKRTRTKIPPPIREDLNNVILLGLWHGPVAPPSSLLLDKIVDNIKLLAATGINVYINNKIIHFMIHVQLFTGDFPARAKCNQLVSHNGFYACSRCLFDGLRCSKPCGKHTLYKWTDFIQRPQKQRTQQHINTCAQQISAVNTNVFGVIGISPLSSVLSIPDQSTYLLSEWHDVLKQNPTALNFINKCLDDIKYPHTFNRRPLDFSNYTKWKASELRTFMIYIALPVLVKLRLNIPNCFPDVYLSHFILLFIYIRVLRHFDDRDEIKNMPKFIHIYLSHFSHLYDPCKELYSVHALVHLWQQVEQHGGLAYHR